MAIRITLLVAVYLITGFGLSYVFYPEWGKAEGLLRSYGCLLFAFGYGIYNVISSHRKIKP